MMNMPTLLKLKVKANILGHKANKVAGKLIEISLFQLFLIALILLPFAFLNLKGLYELLYVVFGLILFLIFLSLHKDKDFVFFFLAIILFIIAGVIYLQLDGPLQNITNPLINFFIFFSSDFMLANIIYFVIGPYNHKSLEEQLQETKKLLDRIEQENKKIAKKEDEMLEDENSK